MKHANATSYDMYDLWTALEGHSFTWVRAEGSLSQLKGHMTAQNTHYVVTGRSENESRPARIDESRVVYRDAARRTA